MVDFERNSGFAQDIQPGEMPVSVPWDELKSAQSGRDLKVFPLGNLHVTKVDAPRSMISSASRYFVDGEGDLAVGEARVQLSLIRPGVFSRMLNALNLKNSSSNGMADIFVTQTR